MVTHLDVSPVSPEISIYDGTLTDKRLKFAIAYCGPAKFNATEAARLAGYATSGAHVIGHKLRKDKLIRERIDAYLQDESLTAVEVLRELTDVAMKPLGEFVIILGRDKLGNVTGAKMDASAKMKALELLAKAHGLLSDKIDVRHSGDVTMTHRVEPLRSLSNDAILAIDKILQEQAIEAEGHVE